MRTSETITKIAPALLAAQRQITFAAKDAKNPHFKNTYASLPSVIDAIKGALNENGIVFIQTASPSEKGALALSTRLLHESGEWIEDTATVPLPKSDPQGYGSAATYARRYSLAAIMGLYQYDDDGNAAMPDPARPAGGRQAAAAPVHTENFEDLETLDDFTDVYTAMREAEDMETLQHIFGNAWKKAPAKEKTGIKAAYDKRKEELA